MHSYTSFSRPSMKAATLANIVLDGQGKWKFFYLVPDRKPPIFPISSLGSNFNPQNTLCIPSVKIMGRLELENILQFLFLLLFEFAHFQLG